MNGRIPAAVSCAIALVVPRLLVADDTRRPVPAATPLPDRFTTLAVDDPQGVAIFADTSPTASVAGFTLPHAAFRVLETRVASGCHRLWVRIGPGAWVCGDHATLTRGEPTPPVRTDVVLPWSYAFTSRNGTRVLDGLGGGAGASTETWESNWGFAIVETTMNGGERWLRTLDDHYVRRTDVYRASPSNFAGGSFRELEGASTGVPFGWIVGDGARAVSRPGADGATGTPVARLSRVTVRGVTTVRGVRYANVGEGRWVTATDVRWIAPAPPPPDVDPTHGERWIDVDLTTQTLLAYAGTQPVYATIVSTGGAHTPTRTGTFRIHARHLARTMDNTEASNLPSHYRLADVPFVQFFDDDRGLHAVYWHDHFGTARSHGCVNLAPRDARVLFDFTSHPLAPGWAWRTVPDGAGTVVRVRGHYAG